MSTRKLLSFERDNALAVIEIILERWDNSEEEPEPKCIYCGGDIESSYMNFNKWSFQCGNCGKLFNISDVIDEIQKVFIKEDDI